LNRIRAAKDITSSRDHQQTIALDQTAGRKQHLRSSDDTIVDSPTGKIDTNAFPPFLVAFGVAPAPGKEQIWVQCGS
jgi:hypothetical protein